jgi:hypothetical protein
MRQQPGAVEDEFQDLALGDKRLDRRAMEIVSSLAPSPADSFPEQMGSEAEQEALYRFLSNPKVTMEALLAGHVRATHERIRSRSTVRIVHDTTAFRYAGNREGLGIIRGDVKGFLGHTSLAISADETREPLGVLALRPYVRSEAVLHRGMTMNARKKVSRAKPRCERESSRWETQAMDVSRELPDGVRAIHLMDQEADDFVLLAELQRTQLDFVVRVSPARKTTNDRRADVELSAQPTTIFRTVHLTPRPRKQHVKVIRLARSERSAELHLRWGTVSIPRGADIPSNFPKELHFTVVHVFEPRPPAGEEAVEWMLFTSERADNLEQATAIVDHYRARWIIEEYFKALKTGCAIEKRQLTSFDGLTRALALFVPVAWHLLLLRHLAREMPTHPAAIVLDTEQLLLLRALLEDRGRPFPTDPNARDAMLGVAALGGHIRNNGDPGWLVLGRGYTRFVEAEMVWRLARRSDQS